MKNKQIRETNNLITAFFVGANVRDPISFKNVERRCHRVCNQSRRNPCTLPVDIFKNIPLRLPTLGEESRPKSPAKVLESSVYCALR